MHGGNARVYTTPHTVSPRHTADCGDVLAPRFDQSAAHPQLQAELLPRRRGRRDGVVRYVGWAVPEAVYVDVDVIGSAPARLNRAGVGDIAVADSKTQRGGGYVSLAYTPSNQPAFSYYDSWTSTLMYANRSGATWSERPISTAPTTARFSSISRSS